MALAHISIGKALCWTLGAVGAFLFAVDPTWKMFIVGALIASIPPTITGIFALRLQAKNAISLGRVEQKVDGAATVLRANFDKQSDELSASQGKLAHAEGHREGSDEERARDVK
jgi:hypothetical protein